MIVAGDTFVIFFAQRCGWGFPTPIICKSSQKKFITVTFLLKISSLIITKVKILNILNIQEGDPFTVLCVANGGKNVFFLN